jgi:hypothetical protein
MYVQSLLYNAAAVVAAVAVVSPALRCAARVL